MSLVFCFLVHYWLCDLTGGSILVHSRSSLLSLYDNLFSYSASKCWPNYSGITLLVKDICSTAPYSGASRPSDKGEPGHPDPEIRGEGGWSPKKFFRPFRPQFGPKIRGTRASPRSATAIERGVLNFAIAMIYHVGNYSTKNFRSDLTDLYGCLLPRKDVFTYNSWD